MGEKDKSILDKLLPKEDLNNLVLTCSLHEECKTCQYYYCSCDGLSNHTDPRVKQIPERERDFIKRVWLKLDWGVIYYQYWLRFKDIGVEFKNLFEVKALSQNKIKQILEKANHD